MAKQEVEHDKAGQCFYLGLSMEREQCPRVHYQILSEQRVDLDHTYTPTHLQGRGLARVVVEGALEYFDAHHMDYSASSCSYVQKVLKERGGGGGGRE